VPEGQRNGSWEPTGVQVGLAAAVVAILCGSCLDPNADPIVLAPVSPGVDAGPGVDSAGAACDPGAPIVLYYRAGQGAASTDQIDFLYKVVNNTGAPIPLTSLAVRYYFTNELTVSNQTAVFYTSTCCGSTSHNGFDSDVIVTVNTIPAVSGADTYIETTFDAAAGDVQNGDYVQVEVGFHATAYTQNLQQTNDYSFIATATGTQAAWDACPTQCSNFQSCRMTVYKDGVLVWGQAP
jgi:hypothetical protein